MTPQEQMNEQMQETQRLRIVLCEALGWKELNLVDCSAPFLYGISPSRRKAIPPSLDHNLCALVRESLTEEERVEYCVRLNEVVRRGKPAGDGLSTWYNLNATIQQQAAALEAALKGRK